MSDLAQGIVLGFVGFHVVYFLIFAIVWWTKVRKSGDIPEQVQEDFTRVRESLKRRASDARQ